METLAKRRVQSIDLLRGLIMVLMAIDHVRVYSGLPAGGPDPGIFFARWVTHFCAPGFVFLAGTSAFFYGDRTQDKRQLARFLFSRGIILVLLELTVIRFLWSFNFHLTEFFLAGVIWMLGWCMVLMSALIWLRPGVVGGIGLAIIFGQQLFALVPHSVESVSFQKFWEFIYTSGFDGPESMSILYVIVPWIGVMAAGYGFGEILKLDVAKRNRACLWIGLGAIIVFLVAAFIASNNNPEDTRPILYRLLDQRKYPASQLYLLMTLGPIIALIPAAERTRGLFSNALIVFGKVPFLYYLLHILVIHLSAFVIHLIEFGAIHNEWYSYAPYTSVPEKNQWNLALVYVVFLIDVFILYFPCKWYAEVKAHRPSVITSYI
jgi:uncharacterized membrane protein